MHQSEKPGAAEALKRALDAYLGAVEAQYGMELWRLTTTLLRACRPVVACSHNFDRDRDPHQS
jgi:hypothetical protein